MDSTNTQKLIDMTLEPNGDYESDTSIHGTSSVCHSTVSVTTVAPSLVELPMEPRAAAEGQSRADAEAFLEDDNDEKPAASDVTSGRSKAVRYVNGQKVST